MKPFQKLIVMMSMASTLIAFPATAQEPFETRTLDQHTVSMGQSPQSYGVLHVNVTTGSDEKGTGSAEAPYRTITQALQIAPTTSTVILLAPGHYSQESGEQFPLRLRPGITIQGNTGETRNTIIAGGGDFQAGAIAENATILTADRSGLANVVVSNPKGSGVWITTGTPILRRVALVSNADAGIQIIDSAPIVENSYFNRNQYGLTIQGNGRAVVRGNYFEATGRAITVASPAIPVINNNRIARNRVGIALKNNARPVLEANVLNGNQRNGIVEVENTATAVESPPLDLHDTVAAKVSEVTSDSNLPTSLPTVLGQEQPAVLVNYDSETDSDSVRQARHNVASVVTTSSEASNELEASNNLETNNITVRQPIAGEDTDSDEQIVFEENRPTNAISSYRQHLALSSNAPAPITTDNVTEERRASREAPVSNRQEPLLDPDVSIEQATEEITSDGAIAIAVIPSNTSESMPNELPNHEQDEGISKLLARLNRTPTPVSSTRENNEVAIPDVPVAANITAAGQRLPVPSAAIPSSSGSTRLTPPGTIALAETFRYRVLVNTADADALQNLVPDAFRTQVGRQTFMQAGAYVNEADAQARLEWLQQNGINGQVDLRN
ncbi:MAG: DUF1565 domain-containing protein [Cyanobacteria bacterium P01_H01_bin.105]